MKNRKKLMIYMTIAIVVAIVELTSGAKVPIAGALIASLSMGWYTNEKKKKEREQRPQEKEEEGSSDDNTQ